MFLAIDTSQNGRVLYTTSPFFFFCYCHLFVVVVATEENNYWCSSLECQCVGVSGAKEIAKFLLSSTPPIKSSNIACLDG